MIKSKAGFAALIAMVAAAGNAFAAGVNNASALARASTPKRSTAQYSRTKPGRGPGWSHAHVKRMAKKRRNVLRNRKAHRG
jgi:hypothetical protein